MKSGLACVAVLAIVVTPAFAQVPAGPEFQVNTFTFADEWGPSATADAQGRFVIGWSSDNQDGSSTGAYAQRYDAAGRPQGGEFRVNTFTPGFEHGQTLAMDGSGRFAATWLSQQDGDSLGVMAQRFEASGARRGGEFQVNGYTTSYQFGSAIAADAAGGFVVVWESGGQDGDRAGIFGQRYDPGGVRRGAEFQVNTFTYAVQIISDVAADAAGDFVVVWQSYPQDGNGFGVFGQRFDASGARRGGEFQVNIAIDADQSFAAVASDPAGNFVVAYNGTDGSGFGVLAQRFDAAGARRGAEFQVNIYTYSFQGNPDVASDDLGNFVVTWSGLADDGGGSQGVFGRRFTAAGVPRGPEFQINTYTTGSQIIEAVASDDVGNFVVAWTGYDQDGSGTGIFAQRFGGLRPKALAVDTSAGGNGIWEPGESVALLPTWRNEAGAPRMFAAALSGLTGPAGATYALTDATGDYGTVAADTNAPCTDCYGASVSTFPSRPLHWDAEVVESITPDTLGQQKKWRLHVGASFPDVSPASAFYPAVETLLHHSVTGGCLGGTAFCPGASTMREQMAVFVLVARESRFYRPPACGAPRFVDVPAASPFCPWIEELARRGVVSGCAPDSYCPGSPVTREQMAVLLLRTLDPALQPPPCAPPNLFNDVPESSPYCRWIEELATRGVTGGCGGGAYCPMAPVTREQMAVFVTATFGLRLYGP